MSAPQQLLEVDPQNELLFRGPFHLPSAAFLRLTNVAEKTILFKIKTTAPKKYCVRPSAGILTTGNHVDIVLSLQPFSYDNTEKYKDKFLIQSAVAPDGDINLEQVWRTIPNDQIIDTKIRCVFDRPHGPSVNSEMNTSSLSHNNQTEGNNLTCMIDSANVMQFIKEESSQIKEENIHLKDEIAQLRKEIRDSVTAPSSSVSIKTVSNMSMLSVISGIVLGVLGFLVGKYAF